MVLRGETGEGPRGLRETNLCAHPFVRYAESNTDLREEIARIHKKKLSLRNVWIVTGNLSASGITSIAARFAM
jgi:hypothetical protein